MQKRVNWSKAEMQLRKDRNPNQKMDYLLLPRNMFSPANLPLGLRSGLLLDTWTQVGLFAGHSLNCPSQFFKRPIFQQVA